MQFGAILNALSFVVPGIIAGTNKLVKGNEKYLIAIAAYFLLSRFAKVAAEQDVSTGIQNPTTGGPMYQNSDGLAIEYYKALNPFGGFPWLPNGTDEAKLFELAGRTYNYAQVFNAYRKKYDRNLTDDITNDLDVEEYRQFLAILNK